MCITEVQACRSRIFPSSICTVRGGMDSVFYFVNPTDNTDRLSIFNFHSRFTASEVTRQVKENHSNYTYDKYDTDNLDMSYVWLMDALDDTLKIAIRPQLVPNMSGPELFMTMSLRYSHTPSVPCARKSGIWNS